VGSVAVEEFPNVSVISALVSTVPVITAASHLFGGIPLTVPDVVAQKVTTSVIPSSFSLSSEFHSSLSLSGSASLEFYKFSAFIKS